MSKTTKKSPSRRASRPIVTVPPTSLNGRMVEPLSHLQVIAACVNGDDTTLSWLIPCADQELPGLFGGTGHAMGFTSESIHASTLRVLHDGYDKFGRDEAALTSSAFALGFVVAARLFGGVR